MRKIIIYTLSFFMLGGCSVYKEPVVPPLQHPAQFKSQTTTASTVVNEKWWENFHDTTLNQLVELTLKNNNHYQIALNHIQIASTYVEQNKSNLFPQVGIGFNSSRNKSAPILNGQSGVPAQTFNLQQLSGTVSYQVDLWNQMGNTVKQAKADEAATVADSQRVKSVLIASVVNTYLHLQALHANQPTLKAERDSARQLLQLHAAQYHAGLINFNTVDDAKNKVALINANLHTLAKQKQILRNTLAYLSGEYPEHFQLKIQPGFKHFYQNNIIPAGIPAQVIAHRPDIQQAYQQVRSYGYLEKEKLANFLPSVNLTATDGYASTALGGLLSSANNYWNYGLFATQYVFDYSLRTSEHQRAQYQYEAAILNYKNTAIHAFKEVDSALSSYQEDNEILHHDQKRYRIAKDKLQLAAAQYQSGLANESLYLRSLLNTLQARNTLTHQKLIVAKDIAQVYTALGVGL